MIEQIPAAADNTLVFSAHGVVTGEDYEKVLIPALEEKVGKQAKIRFLYHLGSDFKGYTTAAVWDDVKLGSRFARSFERIAVVTEVPWMITAVKFCSLFVGCPVRIFSNREIVEARDWLAA
jgi:hypothetical protein